jgi:hypothetical protein
MCGEPPRYGQRKTKTCGNDGICACLEQRCLLGHGGALSSDAEEPGTDGPPPECAGVIRELLYIVHSGQLTFAAVAPSFVAYCAGVCTLLGARKIFLAGKDSPDSCES